MVEQSSEIRVYYGMAVACGEFSVYTSREGLCCFEDIAARNGTATYAALQRKACRLRGSADQNLVGVVELR